MKLPLTVLALALSFAACASTDLSRVDSGLLAELTDAERRPVAEARVERDARSDAHAQATRERKAAARRVDLAESALEVAEAAFAQAELAAEIAADSTVIDRTGTQARVAYRRAELNASDAQLALRVSELELAEVAERLAAAEARLADARVQHAKAEAVHSLALEDAQTVSVRDFLIQVRENEAQVADARTTYEEVAGDVEAANAAYETARREAEALRVEG